MNEHITDHFPEDWWANRLPRLLRWRLKQRFTSPKAYASDEMTDSIHDAIRISSRRSRGERSRRSHPRGLAEHRRLPRFRWAQARYWQRSRKRRKNEDGGGTGYRALNRRPPSTYSLSASQEYLRANVGPDPLKVYLQKAEKKALSRRQRRVMKMTHHTTPKVTQREQARRLGCSVRTVKREFARSQAALREWILEHPPTGSEK